MKILIVSKSCDVGGIEVSLINFLHFVSDELHAEVDLMLLNRGGKLLDRVPAAVNILPPP